MVCVPSRTRVWARIVWRGIIGPLLMNALSEPRGSPQRSYGRVNPESARRENGVHNEQTHVRRGRLSTFVASIFARRYFLKR